LTQWGEDLALAVDQPIPLDLPKINEESAAADTLEEADNLQDPRLSHATEQDDELRLEVVFIDQAAENYQQLVDDLLSQADDDRQLDVYQLNSAADGMAQITEVLATYESLDAVHLVSHGSEGRVQLGNNWLDIDSVADHANEFAIWNNALQDGADLLIYGCDLASNSEGRALVEALGEQCDCDVAATVDDTGHTSLGGDWDLEFATGVIDTAIAFTTTTQNEWVALLAVDSVLDDFNGAPSFSGSDGSQAWSGPWIEEGQIDGPGLGKTLVEPQLGQQGLSVGKDTWAWREADLSGAGFAELSFDYARINMELDDTPTVEVSTAGGGAWNLIDSLTDPAANGVIQSISYDISSYIDNDTPYFPHVCLGISRQFLC